MKIILLLFLSLMTGFSPLILMPGATTNKLPLTRRLAETVSKEVKTCQDGWVEITCKYPQKETKYNKVQVVLPTNIIQSNHTDQWEKRDRFFLFHNTTEKFLKFIVRPSKVNDTGSYSFKFDPDTSPQPRNVAIVVEKENCKMSLNQTAYRTAKTTIRCDYSDLDNLKIKFICKDNNYTCKEIKSQRRFTLTNTSSSFALSIINVTLYDAGVYWCGVKEADGRTQTGISKIHLEVQNIPIVKRNPAEGKTLTYYCKYSGNVSNFTKFICKGENQNECQQLGNTSDTSTNTRFMMKDNKINKTTKITMINVTAADSGTYWCGAENSDKERSKVFIRMVVLTVGTTPAQTFGDMKKYWIIGSVVLLLVIILITIYKRNSHLRNTDSRAAELHPTEDIVYEEGQENQEAPETHIYANNP